MSQIRPSKNMMSLLLVFLLLTLFSSISHNSVVNAQSLISSTDGASTPVQLTNPAISGDDNKPGSDGLGDSLYPTMGNGGYDVQHYTLDLVINDVTTSDLCGTTTIEAKSIQNLSSFNLDFLGFTVEKIIVDQQPARFERRGQELTITPVTSIDNEKIFTSEISYCGIPPENNSISYSEPVLSGWVVYEGGSFVLGQPDGAATFFPVNDHPLDKATYTFKITVPKPYEVAANGVLKKISEQADTFTYFWEVHQPMASYLATVNIGEFDSETEKGPNGIPIRNYYSTTLDKKYLEPFALQSEMMTLFNDRFGTYPFEVYGSIILDTTAESALETQTLSIFGVDQLDLDDIPASEQLVAHELAHQWFGDSISVADWGEIWLNEGFATYAEGLWIEHRDGPEALNEWVASTYGTVVADYDTLVKPGKPSAKDLFNEGVYLRAGLTWHALRLEIGDKVFFEFLHTYFDRFKGGNVRTRDVIGVAEEVSGKNLDSFFDGWLYAEDLPSIPELKLEME